MVPQIQVGERTDVAIAEKIHLFFAVSAAFIDDYGLPNYRHTSGPRRADGRQDAEWEPNPRAVLEKARKAKALEFIEGGE